MTGLLEDFRSHVSGSAACCGQDVELLFVHDSGQTKVGNEEICIILWGSKQEVFRLQVSMDDAVVVEVCDSG